MDAEVECSPDKLYFPQAGFQINLKNAEVWQPPELPQKIQSAQERQRQIMLIIHEILGSKREATFLPFLDWMVTRSQPLIAPDHPIPEHIQTLMDLQCSVWENEPAEAGRILDSFLGYGPGLTPSGDDFIWGFLITLNRWQALLCPKFDVGELNEIVLAVVLQKTSSLSATLIECATHGWADANMLVVLDLLFTGQGWMNDLVEKVLDYGHSSGVDAFAGMAAAIDMFMD